ncbi:hypothetical protein [Rubripirellula reticaptiva]|uniref:Cytochrome C n=1 Tax=Rubripirellula reticaptiva TaxID=2528013 RepID=A0A5C6EJQ3_9BACT|nr:hypothetical protein [Rubripirellula reticaptiva]TWU47846.1 hypothetical protein Poly59_46880 [Rubripirellula reticaptiva]
MSKKFWTLMTVAGMLATTTAMPSRAEDADDAAPKYKTKEIMKKAMKGPLLKKVAGGEASEEEKKELHAMMVALAKNTPEKGEKESWDKLTAALVKSSQAVIDGKENAGEQLTKAANCKACHTPHK